MPISVSRVLLPVLHVYQNFKIQYHDKGEYIIIDQFSHLHSVSIIAFHKWAAGFRAGQKGVHLGEFHCIVTSRN